MGEFKQALSADGDAKLRTHIGGQALIEGVMMRGRYNWAVAVRQPDGEIYTEEHDLASGKRKNRWMYWPIVRGCRAFVESLALGYKALSISGEHAYDFDEDEEGGSDSDAASAPALRSAEAPAELAPSALKQSSAPPRPSAAAASETSEPEPEKPGKDQGQNQDSGMGAIMTVSMIVGLVIGIAIFVVVPAALSNLILGEAAMNGVAWNVLDGVIRVAIFIAYIWAISLMPDIHRLFCYHGAEHKTIHCYEHGLALTPENAQSFPRLHVRCGTAFMIMVMIIAIFVYTVFGAPINSLVDMTGVMEGPGRFALVILTRVILLPLIAGVSYEITVRWAGTHPENPLVKVVLWPGMQMQRLTTNPPDAGMLECAIAAMKIVIAREELEAARQRGAQVPLAGEDDERELAA